MKDQNIKKLSEGFIKEMKRTSVSFFFFFFKYQTYIEHLKKKQNKH